MGVRVWCTCARMCVCVCVGGEGWRLGVRQAYCCVHVSHHFCCPLNHLRTEKPFCELTVIERH